MSDTLTVPFALVLIDQVTVREEWNPRTSHDQEALEELAASIAAQGLLTPVLVCPGEDDGLELLDGHRRLAACRLAGVSQVPVYVQTGADAPGQLAAALASNMRRAALNPIEEAAAFARLLALGWRQRHIAETLGVPRQFVTDRLRLLKLSEGVQAGIADGTTPLALTRRLAEIGAVSEPLADFLAGQLREQRFAAQDLVDDPGQVLADVADDACAAGVALFAVPGWVQAEDLRGFAGAEPVIERLERLAAEAAEGHHYHAPPGVRLEHATLDAGLAYGCGLEWAEDRSYWRQGFLCDPEFVLDQLSQALDVIEKRQAENRAAEETREQTRREELAAALGQPEGADQDQSLRALERQAAKEAARGALIANEALGVTLAKRFEEPAQITRPMAELLVRLLLSQMGGELCYPIRLVHPRLRRTETTTLKSGEVRTKVVYPEPFEVRDQIERWILGAPSPERIVGRMLQVLLGAFLADQEAVAQTQRRHTALPSDHSGVLVALVNELIGDALPERIGRAWAERIRHMPGDTARPEQDSAEEDSLDE
jgi:ParB/RepB/Spo0J family partition protein